MNREMEKYMFTSASTTHLVKIKDVPYICNSLPPSLLSPNVEGTIDEFLFPVLNVHHLFLDGALGDELVDEGLLGLSHPVGAVEALLLSGRVPSRVEKEEMVGSSQVQTNSSCH